jgi:predicted nucleic acid-binding protein
VSLFVDTSAFYAILVRTERDHTPVVTAFKRALDRGVGLYTTNYVLVETTALLQDRIGLAPVRDLEERVVPLLKIHWIDEEVHRRALERLVRMDRHQVSLVDAASFVVMEREGITDVLGLDADFTVEGFRLIP